MGKLEGGVLSRWLGRIRIRLQQDSGYTVMFIATKAKILTNLCHDTIKVAFWIGYRRRGRCRWRLMSPKAKAISIPTSTTASTAAKMMMGIRGRGNLGRLKGMLKCRMMI